MEIENLVKQVKHLTNCVVFPPIGIPVLPEEYHLPNDLNHFYDLCGGMILFENTAFPTYVVSPQDLVVANPVIFSGVDNSDLTATKGDLSWSWYLIGKGPNSQFITIDLAPERLGMCYDSFWDRHPRDSDIIAHSFTELLSGLLKTRGEYYYWDALDFKSLGNPYTMESQ